MSRRLREAIEAEPVRPKNRKEELALTEYPDYSDGRTKQSFKDETDVNKIIQRAQQIGGLAHVQKYPEAVYGEFSGEMDLLTAHERMSKAQEIFNDLPSEVRAEFHNDALRFVKYAGSLQPGELLEKIPQLAEPGRVYPNPVQRGGQGAGAATAATIPAAEPPAKPAESPAEPGSSAEGASPPSAEGATSSST